MSTRKKETGSLRESRGTSPSPSPSRSPSPSTSGTTARRASPSSSKARSLDSSPSSGKSIPNYLRPTLASSGDASKSQGDRKPLPNTDSALKSNLARRRSFEKPPSSAKSLKLRGVSPTSTFRSSSFSFSSKTTTASAMADRSVKSTRDSGGKQQPLYARSAGAGTAKKSSSTTVGKKGETKPRTASSRKEPKLNNHNVSEDQEKEHDQDSLMGEEEEMDDAITRQLEAEIQKTHSPTILEEDDAAILEESSLAVLGRDSSGDIEESCMKEQEMREDNFNERDDIKLAVGEEENAAPRETRGRLSNDMIEETAKKLQKQNSRVRALAGAFETVISMQDDSKHK